MCGIAGILNFRGEAVAPQLLGRMLDLMKHRGPDSTGIHRCVPNESMGLGHVRLSIIDVAGGHQPMPNEDGSLWITFNGEIFNYIELRENAAALFAKYAALLRSLRLGFPSITFVPATVPLTTSAAVPGWTRKVLEVSLRRTLHLYDGADADNFKRNEFNELVRRAHGSEDIFDIAKVESIRPDGRLEGFQTGSTFYSSLAHEFSNDGGHLNKREGGSQPANSSAPFLLRWPHGILEIDLTPNGDRDSSQGANEAVFL